MRRPYHTQMVHRLDRLAQLFGAYRSAVSKQIHRISPNIQVWQRNYYERVIRNEKELERIRKYIQNNPFTWNDDQENRK